MAATYNAEHVFDLIKLYIFDHNQYELKIIKSNYAIRDFLESIGVAELPEIDYEDTLGLYRMAAMRGLDPIQDRFRDMISGKIYLLDYIYMILLHIDDILKGVDNIFPIYYITAFSMIELVVEYIQNTDINSILDSIEELQDIPRQILITKFLEAIAFCRHITKHIILGFVQNRQRGYLSTGDRLYTAVETIELIRTSSPRLADAYGRHVATIEPIDWRMVSISLKLIYLFIQNLTFDQEMQIQHYCSVPDFQDMYDYLNFAAKRIPVLTVATAVKRQPPPIAKKSCTNIVLGHSVWVRHICSF
jgi:hypothetical protein